MEKWYHKSPEISNDLIEEKDARFEVIMLALRTTDGLNVKEFNKKFGIDFDTEYKTQLLKKGKYLLRDGDNLKIKDEYLYVQNDILLEFM